MKRKDAIKIISKTIQKKVAVISSTGLISRELFAMKDSPNNFYMTGSMGLASSLGLGISVNCPDKKIMVVEGDGSLLMNLGSLTTVGHFRPENLIHIILNNNAYASCSEEPCISNTVNFEKIAKIVGYNKIKKVSTKKELETSIKRSLKEKGPSFILAEIKLGGRRDLPRPLQLEKITKRFKKFLSL